MNKNNKINKNIKNENLENVISDALKKLSELSDANLTIGATITTQSGTTIIPVSKISVGFLSGGGEYGDVSFFKPKAEYPHTGASGGILSVKPSGFLVEKKGVVKFVHCPSDAIEKVIDSVDDWFNSQNGKNSKS